MDCLFCKIASHEIKSNIIYEDETMVVFPDIHPVSSFHVLIVPKVHVEDLSNLENFSIWNTIMNVVLKLVEQNKLMGKGYRLVINGGGAQAVNHLHVHLIGNILKDRRV